MNKILELDWVGRRFVYKSKYGSETFGTIVNVGIQNNCTFDYKTLLQLDKDLDTARKESKSGYKVDPITEYNITQNARKNPSGWSGFRPEVFIVSEKDNKYMLNEIFILNGEKG